MLKYLFVVLVLAAGGYNVFHFAQDQRWVYAGVLGVLLPLAALYEWYLARKRSEDSATAADRMLALVTIAIAAIPL